MEQLLSAHTAKDTLLLNADNMGNLIIRIGSLFQAWVAESGNL